MDSQASLGLTFAAQNQSRSSQQITRSCPACGSPNGKLETESHPKAEDLPFDTLREHWIGFFKEKSFFSYVRCQCGLLFSPHYFSENALTSLYGSMPDNTAGVNARLLERTQNSYFQFLREYSKFDGDFLEFGPDIGLFTQFVARESQNRKFWLFEPNVSVHGALQQRCANNEVHLQTNLFNLDDVPSHSVSNVALIHVMDHMLQPKELLSSLGKRLKKGARVLIVTHDERSLLARVLRARWPAYCLQHPHLFNPKSTRALLESAGYRVLETRKSTNFFPVTYLIKHLVYSLGLGSISLPEWPWLALPLRLGNIMTVAEYLGGE